MMSAHLAGLHVALVTPFTDRSCVTIDRVTLREHMLDLEAYVNGYVFGGFNGEGTVLSTDHMRQLGQALLELRREFARKEFTFGIMRNTPEEILAAAREVAGYRPDAILLAPPLQGTEYDLARVFQGVREITGLPVCAYNTGKSDRELRVSDLDAIDDLLDGDFIGVKNSRKEALRDEFFKGKRDYRYIEGDDRRAAGTIAITEVAGVPFGIISGSANYVPNAQALRTICDAPARRLKAQEELDRHLNAFAPFFEKYGGEQPVWKALAYGERCRAVLPPLREVLRAGR